MIVQRKVDIGGYSGIQGDYWEDVETSTPKSVHLLDWLATLSDPVGTEYRIIDGEKVLTAVMGERNYPARYTYWK